MAQQKQRSYPRVSNIKDQDIKETIRLLWDQVHNLNETQASHSGLISAATDAVTTVQDSQNSISKTLKQIAAGRGATQPSTVGGGGSGGASGGSGSGQPGGGPTPTPTPSQHPDQTGTVIQAKADLVAALVDLSGVCGSFQIVKLVAWRLMTVPGQETISLIAKGGTNCDGYSVDAIMYTSDGTVWDLLINSDDGTNATPNWGYAGTRPLSDARPPIPPAI